MSAGATNGMAPLSSLTNSQREELHQSILEYMHRSGFEDAYEALKKDADMPDFSPSTAPQKVVGLLEKKWTGTVRLQKKVIAYEQQITNLEAELKAAPTGRRAASQADWLPSNDPSRILEGHRKQVISVVFHPTFSIVATASEDCDVKVWDWQSGECEATLKGHTQSVKDVDFDAKGQFLATSSADTQIKLWDSNNQWRCTKTLAGHEHVVSAVRFLPGGAQLVSASRDETIRIWEASSGYCVRTIQGGAWIKCMSLAEDGQTLVTGGDDQVAKAWNLNSAQSKAECREHAHVVDAIALAPAAAYPALRQLGGMPASNQNAPGLFAASGDRDKTIIIWDTASGQPVKKLLGHDGWIRGLCWAPNGKFLLSCADDGKLKVWDLKQGGRCCRTVENPHDENGRSRFLTSMAWARAKVDAGPRPDGESATAVVPRINAVATTGSDTRICIWTP
ncbi:putative platelet-activating factor acetylhydrolase ib alpha subunit [Ceraceosorus guamensis]|uniref:Putative platelet-activating factor acetylhydrolase ib alpha subunit n=1 Tax=Ceraceosorus guamensis TaxID=1522189 RepID=A0A316VXF1_9BASI|nr:putative platelet-activating factor acetylhydrolase ib alpha subunit [Ceraceosorus guamensis]PWN42150.1 putative platelet-activating factor acetylhydrolase ib alpha subunit [Ceraceosorus guamensis]